MVARRLRQLRPSSGRSDNEVQEPPPGVIQRGGFVLPPVTVHPGGCAPLPLRWVCYALVKGRGRGWRALFLILIVPQSLSVAWREARDRLTAPANRATVSLWLQNGPNVRRGKRWRSGFFDG